MAVYGPVRHQKNIIWIEASEVHIIFVIFTLSIILSVLMTVDYHFGIFELFRHQTNIIWTSEASIHIIFFWWRTGPYTAIWPSVSWTICSVPQEGYSGNVSCALNLIFTLLFLSSTELKLSRCMQKTKVKMDIITMWKSGYKTTRHTTKITNNFKCLREIKPKGLKEANRNRLGSPSILNSYLHTICSVWYFDGPRILLFSFFFVYMSVHKYINLQFRTMVACRYYNNKNRTPMNYKTNNSCELQINQNVTLIKQHKASINILVIVHFPLLKYRCFFLDIFLAIIYL
jgi:hypothetical protein